MHIFITNCTSTNPLLNLTRKGNNQFVLWEKHGHSTNLSNVNETKSDAELLLPIKQIGK